MPQGLKQGDKIRFVSPASSPDRPSVEATADMLRGWGLAVDFGAHAFGKLSYLSGSDEDRLADFNAALQDPSVRAIFATTGGKGSYRIADRLDFVAARRDPKFLVGFSDITILQMALQRNGVGGAIHGAPQGDERDSRLRELLFSPGPIKLAASEDEPTAVLTTFGVAEGILVGGNLDMMATAAGWALPRLTGCILLIEAVNMFLGQVDRQLSMLIKAAHLDGVAGIALGQFTDFKPSGSWTIVDMLGHHLAPLGVPILGGLPVGHGENAQCIPMGRLTKLDTKRRELQLT